MLLYGITALAAPVFHDVADPAEDAVAAVREAWRTKAEAVGVQRIQGGPRVDGAALEPCPTDRSGLALADTVERSRGDLFYMRFAPARDALDRALEVAPCRPAELEPGVLAALYYLRGMVEVFDPEASGAAAWFRETRAIDPSFEWDVRFGDRGREAFDAAVPDATVELRVLPASARVRLDGLLVTGRVHVPPGVHALEAGDLRGWVTIEDSTTVVVPAELELAADAATAEALHIVYGDSTLFYYDGQTAWRVDAGSTHWEQRKRGPLSLVIAAGLTLTSGQQLISPELHEPARRVGLPIEVGGVFQRQHWWVDARVRLVPQLGGQLVYMDASETVKGVPASVGGLLTAGRRLGPLELGLAVGADWPARLIGRVVVRAPMGPVHLALRVGANVATTRPTEPAAALLLGWRGP